MKEEEKKEEEKEKTGANESEAPTNEKPKKEALIPEHLRPPKPEDPPEKDKKKEKKIPVLPTIKLMKSQKKLWIAKITEITAMKRQAMSIVAQLGAEIQRNLIEVFAEEHEIEQGPGKYGFDDETMTFVDANEYKKKMGQPQSLIPKDRIN